MTLAQSKIFGVGLSKTGTTSLARALKVLGYKTKDYLGVTSYRAGDLSSINLDEIDVHDAITDTPVPSFYRELDLKYPGSKFILTVRDTDAWLKSCKKQFNKKHSDNQNEANNLLFTDLYQCAVFDEEKFRVGYEKFVNGVLEYFSDRPDDLLILNISADIGWEKLCAFLGRSAPDVPFPKANVTQIRWINVNDVIDIARFAAKEIVSAHQIIQRNINRRGESRCRQSNRELSILNKASYVLRGRVSGIRKRARRKACKIITKRLMELDPDIPVISSEINNVPYSQRREWNHFWLVDSLDGPEQLMEPEAAFTVNIALIEDRMPNLGVIYAPSADIVYYAKGGGKAFRIDNRGRETPIQSEIDSMLSSLSDQCGVAAEADNARDLATMSRALAICLAAEGKSHLGQPLEGTMEWETAGAHAVLLAAKMKLICYSRNEELTYNKENFTNDPIIIE